MLHHLDHIAKIARDAAAIGIQHFGAVQAERKADGTLVTEADRAMQRLIVGRLRELEPDPRCLYILGEEDSAALGDANPGVAHPQPGALLAAVDPLDGTSSFASGLPLWGVSIGFLELPPADQENLAPTPVAGVVYLPLLGGPAGWLYQVGPQGPALRNGQPLTVKPYVDWSSIFQLGVPSGFYRWARIRGYHRKLRALGSTAHHLCLVAAGALDGIVIGRTHLWDVAAGAAILARANGVLMQATGAKVDWAALYAGRHPLVPLVAGAPETAAALGQRVEITWRPPAASTTPDPDLEVPR